MQNGQKRARAGSNASVGRSRFKAIPPVATFLHFRKRLLLNCRICQSTPCVSGHRYAPGKPCGSALLDKSRPIGAHALSDINIFHAKKSLTAQNYCFYGERLTFREASHLPENLISEGGGQMSTSAHNLADTSSHRVPAFHRDGSSHTQKNE